MTADVAPLRPPVSAEAVADVLSLSQRLIERAAASTAALDRHDRDALKAAALDVAALARGYEAKVRALRAAAPLPDVIRAKLTAAALTLRESLAPHERRLRAAIEAERRLIGCVAEAARQASLTAQPYSRSGAAETAAMRRSTSAPVTLCRTL